jgi:hypothetical protein
MPDQPPGDPITTRSAAERFIKTRIRPEARVGPGVIDGLITRLTDLGDQVVRKADREAAAGGRTTLLDRDLVEAFETVSPVGSGPAVDPATVFGYLDRMTIEQLGEVVRKIQAWLATRPR